VSLLIELMLFSVHSDVFDVMFCGQLS